MKKLIAAGVLFAIGVAVVVGWFLIERSEQLAGKQWFRFAEHMSDASVERVGDPPQDLVIADLPVSLFEKVPGGADLKVEHHDGWMRLQGERVEALLKIEGGRGVNLAEIGSLQIRVRTQTPGVLDVVLTMKARDGVLEQPWTETVPLHSPGEWVTYRINTSSPAEEVEGTDNRLLRVRLVAPLGTKELDIASIRLLDRRARLGAASYGVIREPVGPDAFRSIFAYCPSRISWKVRVHKEARLDGTWGFLGDAPVEMKLVLKDSMGKQVLASATLSSDMTWTPINVFLNRWEGQDVDIAWQAEGPGGTAALWGSPIIAGGKRGTQPNVIIYLVDALRPDRLGCYGSTKGLTPNIDSLAREGTVFVRAYAASNWTPASVPSMLLGVMPDVHGASVTGYRPREDIPTLAEILAAAGYATASYIANGYSGTFTGLDRGFDQVRCLLNAYSTALIDKNLANWVAKHHNQPFFLYVHTMDPHGPYAPEGESFCNFDPTIGGPPSEWDFMFDPEELKGKVTAAGRRARYDAEIRNADAAVGKLMAWLDELGITDNTIVLLVADHGEHLGEGGEWGHGGPRMSPELLHVPMIWRWPAGKFARAEIEEPVSLLDLFPTILAAAGLQKAAPSHLQGIDLLDVLRTGDEASLSRRVIWSAVNTSDGLLKSGIRGKEQFLSTGDKFVLSLQTGEWRSVSATKENVLAEFLAWPKANLAPYLSAPGEVEISHDQIEALRALGYIR